MGCLIFYLAAWTYRLARFATSWETALQFQRVCGFAAVLNGAPYGVVATQRTKNRRPLGLGAFMALCYHITWTYIAKDGI
jgi:hypothetical protein